MTQSWLVRRRKSAKTVQSPNWVSSCRKPWTTRNASRERCQAGKLTASAFVPRGSHGRNNPTDGAGSRIIEQAFEDAAAPGAVASATELVVDHGPHAVVQAWELVSWLTSQLGWTVQTGNVQQGLEIGWQLHAPHGVVPVRIRRLPEGPPEVLTLRLQCMLGGTPGAVVIRAEESRRHVVVLENVVSAPRSANFQAPSLAELLSKQLSDRERDPVFTESIAVAQLLARSVLD